MHMVIFRHIKRYQNESELYMKQIYFAPPTPLLNLT